MQDRHPPGTDDRAHRDDEMNTSCINRHRHAPLLSFNLQYTTRGVQMIVTLIGIDLAKSIIQVCGVNQAGKRVFNRQVRRARLMELLIKHPDATMAMEAYSFLNEYGLVISGGKEPLLAAMPDLLEDADNGLTSSSRALYQAMYDDWRQMNATIDRVENVLKGQAKADEAAQRLMKIKGWRRGSQRQGMKPASMRSKFSARLPMARIPNSSPASNSKFQSMRKINTTLPKIRSH